MLISSEPGTDVAPLLELDTCGCFYEEAAKDRRFTFTVGVKLHVGNLPYSVTEDELRQLFGQAGTVVSVSLPTDRITGRPRGFGFVEMENQGEAEEAIRKFDGYSMDGRSLRVEMARERESRG